MEGKRKNLFDDEDDIREEEQSTLKLQTDYERKDIERED